MQSVCMFLLIMLMRDMYSIYSLYFACSSQTQVRPWSTTHSLWVRCVYKIRIGKLVAIEDFRYFKGGTLDSEKYVFYIVLYFLFYLTTISFTFSDLVRKGKAAH